jgi:hypothetical protein
MEIADKPHLATHGGHRFSEDCAPSKGAEANGLCPTSELSHPNDSDDHRYRDYGPPFAPAHAQVLFHAIIVSRDIPTVVTVRTLS